MPFHVEGMTNMEWSPHLENSLMDQLSINRIDYVSPNQMTREFGQRTFCVEISCLREMMCLTSYPCINAKFELQGDQRTNSKHKKSSTLYEWDRPLTH